MLKLTTSCAIIGCALTWSLPALSAEGVRCARAPITVEGRPDRGSVSSRASAKALWQLSARASLGRDWANFGMSRNRYWFCKTSGARPTCSVRATPCRKVNRFTNPARKLPQRGLPILPRLGN